MDLQIKLLYATTVLVALSYLGGPAWVQHYLKHWLEYVLVRLQFRWELFKDWLLSRVGSG